ncbi:metallophosphoesterase family protein [Roseovarius indicus]|uniref:Calcineurin-like phosphoesterase superfamily domain protein n=1 Tax=Roseovarius indicus TaxID=540747 RepID=A0A0T5P956_9RHOB|nr:metallophosphoesterase family protein [Roseovarius indicus]KRS17580.1 serine/threonine protein phosphatase [Roseovarius indicus]QEW24690.1 Calcineurin-like phosphoesterase superfamily domain protein [Roseovarius indicus]SFE28625.1 Predicted phosphoesterase [Roseovarius indicus]
MRILAFSDLHLARARAADLVAASSDADLVIGAGDFCNMRQGLSEAMALLSGITAPFVVVPGNAESVEELQAAANPGMRVLHGTGVDVNRLRVFGLGYGVPVTPFGSWSCDLSEEDAGQMLAKCEAADILVLHSPPKGVVDVTSGGQSVGSTAIHDAIERIQPRLAFCGHIHDSWGQTGRIGATQVVNLGPRPNWFDL